VEQRYGPGADAESITLLKRLVRNFRP